MCSQLRKHDCGMRAGSVVSPPNPCPSQNLRLRPPMEGESAEVTTHYDEVTLEQGTLREEEGGPGKGRWKGGRRGREMRP